MGAALSAPTGPGSVAQIPGGRRRQGGGRLGVPEGRVVGRAGTALHYRVSSLKAFLCSRTLL